MSRKVIHTADLYRPHEDPDDHFDVAVQFELYKRRRIDLLSIIIDKPTKQQQRGDTLAIEAQEIITGKKIDYFDGTTSRDKIDNDVDSYFLNILSKTKKKVDIHICGSCSHIATFANKNITLFKKKIHAIYLNAGSGVCGNTLEYNVNLDPKAFSSIFNLPCKIYWIPCFHNNDEIFKIGQFGSCFSFKQNKVLEKMSDEKKNYFLSIFKDTNSLSAVEILNKEILKDELDKLYEETRNIYCFGGFLHCSKLSVTNKGKICSIFSFKRKIYKFIPIKIITNDNGKVIWKRSINKFSKCRIFTINDTNRYSESMSNAMAELLSN